MAYSFHVPQCEQLSEPRLPQESPHEPDAPDDPQGFPIPDDTSHWDVFIPDDDELDPLPEPGDFWIEPEE